MNTNTQVAPIALTISSILIRQDQDGRYCLNDLHKASGADNKHRPSLWLQNQQSKELISELENELAGNPAISSKTKVGTFAIKELVYAYAMWISAKFHIAVIRAYDALQNNTYNKNVIDINLAFPEGMKQMTFKFNTTQFNTGRWVMTLSDGLVMVKPMDDKELSMTFEKWIKYATQERGYIVIKPAELLTRLKNGVG